jgi:hypothetical protein
MLKGIVFLADSVDVLCLSPISICYSRFAKEALFRFFNEMIRVRGSRRVLTFTRESSARWTGTFRG